MRSQRGRRHGAPVRPVRVPPPRCARAHARIRASRAVAARVVRAQRAVFVCNYGASRRAHFDEDVRPVGALIRRRGTRARDDSGPVGAARGR